VGIDVMLYLVATGCRFGVSSPQRFVSWRKSIRRAERRESRMQGQNFGDKKAAAAVVAAANERRRSSRSSSNDRARQRSQKAGGGHEVKRQWCGETG
jgi:hypothetical protein